MYDSVQLTDLRDSGWISVMNAVDRKRDPRCKGLRKVSTPCLFHIHHVGMKDHFPNMIQFYDLYFKLLSHIQDAVNKIQ